MSKTHLFLDDSLILRRSGLRRELFTALKKTDTPIIEREHPWERRMVYLYGTAMHDDGLFRMWYLGVDGEWRFHVCYAASQDGIVWTKPHLGLVDYAGSRRNNIVFPSACVPNIMRNPREDDPDKRYVMVYWDLDPNGRGREEGECTAFSPDGLVWTDYAENPVWKGSAGGTTPGGPGDVVNCFFDPASRQYIAYAKVRRSAVHGDHRIVARGQSDDLTAFSPPEVVLVPDEADTPTTHFYGLAPFFYDGNYLGLLWVFDAADGRIWPEIVTSPDTRAWRRPSRDPFIPLGRDGAFDSSMILTAAQPVVLDDELFFYYGGTATGHDDDPESQTASIGLARLRRDGFAALVAGEETGTLVTRPVDMTGERLVVNADAGRSGYLRVELLDADSQPIPGLSGEAAGSLSGDHVRATVPFGEQEKLRALRGERVQLRIEMRSTRLYSLRFE